MAEKGCWPDWDMAFGRDFCKRRYPPSPTPYRAPRAALVRARLQPRSAARVAAASSQALVRVTVRVRVGDRVGVRVRVRVRSSQSLVCYSHARASPLIPNSRVQTYPPHTLHTGYLNSGVWMGYADAAYALLTELQVEPASPSPSR